MSRQRLVLISDPMCSWCWGMAEEFDQAMQRLRHEVHFDLMLGGINTDSTQPVGAYGRRLMFRLWGEVEATTGQRFGYMLPEQYVHNSVTPCLALEAVREVTGTAPFAMLYDLQRRFFVAGQDITSMALLTEVAASHGVDDLPGLLTEPGLLERVRFQFDNAGAFGTNAMPTLLREMDGRLALLAGGYVDADMLMELLGH